MEWGRVRTSAEASIQYAMDPITGKRFTMLIVLAKSSAI